MIFALVVRAKGGMIEFNCPSIEDLLGRIREFGSNDEIVNEIGLWAISAELGDWLDWWGGWVFRVKYPEPYFVVDDEEENKVRH